MIRTIRASLTARFALLLAISACAALLPATGAAAAEGAISYKRESFKEYQQQLAAGQIKEVTINKRLRSLRVTLKDGSHVLAKYGRHEEPATVARLKAKGVAVTVLTPAQARKELPPVKHKLRYIAGGIVVVVVIVVGAVLFVDRRRKAARD